MGRHKKVQPVENVILNKKRKAINQTISSDNKVVKKTTLLAPKKTNGTPTTKIKPSSKFFKIKLRGKIFSGQMFKS